MIDLRKKEQMEGQRRHRRRRRHTLTEPREGERSKRFFFDKCQYEKEKKGN